MRSYIWTLLRPRTGALRHRLIPPSLKDYAAGGSGSGGLLPDERGSLLTLIRDPFYTRPAKVFGAPRFQDGMTVLTGSGFPGNDRDSFAGDGFVQEVNLEAADSVNLKKIHGIRIENPTNVACVIDMAVQVKIGVANGDGRGGRGFFATRQFLRLLVQGRATARGLG